MCLASKRKKFDFFFFLLLRLLIHLCVFFCDYKIQSEQKFKKKKKRIFLLYFVIQYYLFTLRQLIYSNVSSTYLYRCSVHFIFVLDLIDIVMMHIQRRVHYLFTGENFSNLQFVFGWECSFVVCAFLNYIAGKK